MADLTDVETAIVNIVSSALYPNGTSQPSILPGAAPVSVTRGWPLPATLDADLAAGKAEVTVYPLGGSATTTFQILDNTYLIIGVTYGLSISVAGTVITATGQPRAGEYLTVVADGHQFSQTGNTTQALLAALATQAQAVYPGATSDATTLTIPFGHAMVVRQGGIGTLGKTVWRQRHGIMVCIWAPSDDIRTAAAKAADLALKENIKITLPDTSECVLRYLRTMSTDQQEKAMIYRRDLIYDAEFATVQTFPGYVVTTVDTTIEAIGNGNAEADAIT
jgi:hypothetical protein